MGSVASWRGRRLLLLPAVAVVVALLTAAPAAAAAACFARIFSFGDSLTDTGNYRFFYVNDTREAALRPPYGETYFHRATGRFSDGRLIVDFIADALGLPLVRPYLSGGSAEDFAHGANFAVGGAMALSPDFFRARGVPMGDRVHLDLEMKWFRALLDQLCPGDISGCSNLMSESLFLVGEIGGNDYNIPLLTKVPFEKIRTFPPSVIEKISSTISELIGLGAKTLLVPGNLPIGCVPKYLSRFQSNNEEDYEPETGCLRWLNKFSQYHNQLLMQELERLRLLHPDVTIIYADYYEAAIEIFRFPELFGIEEPLVACCGGKGPYGVAKGAGCGYGDYKVCDNPDKYGSWDDLHPTEAVYMTIAMSLIQSSYAQPSFATTIADSCPRLTNLRSPAGHKALTEAIIDIGMKWFHDCSALAGCSDMMNESLFLVGEIGGNDYNLPLLSRVSIEKIRTFTPSVIAKISSTITELIRLGAKTLVVPGNLPIGCVPKYLLIFKSDNKEDYESNTGCLRWMNEFSQYHNKLLMEELEKLRKLHPSVTIIYADYYGAAMEIFVSPERFGIKDPLVACCGGEGTYGVSLSATCGYGDYKVCDNPDKYGSWDGFHPSEAAYKAIAMGLLRGTYTQPSIASVTSTCPQLTEFGSSVDYKVLYDL